MPHASVPSGSVEARGCSASLPACVHSPPRLPAYPLACPQVGTTGEGPSLPMHIREGMIEEVMLAADGRVPVLVAVTDTVLESALALAKRAAELGAAAIVAAPPYYQS